MSDSNIIIGVVGVCGSGKSELVRRLRERGYQARHIAQEHSFAPDMWQRISNPDVLIFLQVSYPLTLERKDFEWTQKEYDTEITRLRHARQHADLFVETDVITPEDVFDQVLEYLES
jgi:guanylate kinase